MLEFRMYPTRGKGIWTIVSVNGLVVGRYAKSVDDAVAALFAGEPFEG